MLTLEAVKGGSKEPLEHALGIVEVVSPPAGTRHFVSTLERVHLLGLAGWPRKRSRYMVADIGYDRDELRHYCDRHGMRPVIAQRNKHLRTRPGLPRRFDNPLYW